MQVFEGIPASPWLLGPNDLDAPATIAIPGNLGTRSCRLRPALLPVGGWFSGLAGVVCMLWDQDNFDPSTSEAGYKEFKKRFGPALSDELTSLINGGYDDQLSRDGAGNPVPDPPTGRDLAWRLDRLSDAGARTNLVKAITDRVKDSISGHIRDALSDAASFDEGLDPDDLLGVNAQVYLGDELRALRNFELKFTDDDADYTARGHAQGSAVRVAKVDATVTDVQRRLDKQMFVWRRVCWFAPREYLVYAYRLQTTTRFQLRPLVGEQPSSVRWFLDDVPLAGAEGAVNVTFEPMQDYASPPEDVLAGGYPGGSGVLRYRINGPVLDIWNESGAGVYSGRVRAVYAYPGDPSLFPPGQRPVAELIDLGYDSAVEFSIAGVDLAMDFHYYQDVAKCKKVVDDIDRKHIAVNFGKLRVTVGDPPPYRQLLLERVAADARVVDAAGLEALNIEQVQMIGRHVS